MKAFETDPRLTGMQLGNQRLMNANVMRQAFTNKSLDDLPDGVRFVKTNPNQAQGGWRAFQVLDANSQFNASTVLNRIAAMVPTQPIQISTSRSDTSITLNWGAQAMA